MVGSAYFASLKEDLMNSKMLIVGAASVSDSGPLAVIVIAILMAALYLYGLLRKRNSGS